jgi:hypothetical protein
MYYDLIVPLLRSTSERMAVLIQEKPLQHMIDENWSQPESKLLK